MKVLDRIIGSLIIGGILFFVGNMVIHPEKFVPRAMSEDEIQDFVHPERIKRVYVAPAISCKHGEFCPKKPI